MPTSEAASTSFPGSSSRTSRSGSRDRVGFASSCSRRLRRRSESARGAPARAGKPPYLWALLFASQARGNLLRVSVESIANLLLMGVLLDSVCQWLILGVSYPGAALVVGPVLIAAPYAVARGLANRITRHGLEP